MISDLNVALLAAGYSMASASKALGLNHSYLSKFMRKDGHSPDVLPEDVRRGLAGLLGLSEEILRIDPHRPVGFNKSSGLKEYGKQAPRPESDRRNAHMRIDDILMELGRLKERLDRLEGRSGTDPQGKGKPSTRP